MVKRVGVGEGDVNLGRRRTEWQERNNSKTVKGFLEQDGEDVRP